MKETALYPPLKAWLETQGYTVRGEVAQCDIAAYRHDELLVIELKKQASLALLAQAVERQEYADAVYVALPMSREKKRPPHSRHLRRLLRRLGIGLLIVNFLKTKITVEILQQPSQAPLRRRPQKKAVILREIDGRDLDLSPGGMVGGKQRFTAYRHRAIRLASWLSLLGESSPAQLKRLGATKDSGEILRKNLYGWFERIQRGLYCLHPAGLLALEKRADLASLYQKELEEKLTNEPSKN